MGRIRKFEDIEAWQKARNLTNDIYRLTSKGNFARDFGLRDQIRRASVSVILNIAEGFGRKTNKEFARFLIQAHGSVSEVQSVLYVALDQNYITEQEFHQFYNSCESISRMLTKFVQYLLNKKEGGP